MDLFISDKPVHILSSDEIKGVEHLYEHVLDGTQVITSDHLVGNVLVRRSTYENLERFLSMVEVKKLKKLEQIAFDVPDVEVAKQLVKDKFKILKAGGGIVEKEGKILMIYRLKKWDLPKGKLKKKENPKEGAKREVEEECNIKVEVKEKICTTWHSYNRKGVSYLKKINWYRMACLNDKNMQPQVEEDILDVKWMDRKEAEKLLRKSYMSIMAVFEHYVSSF